MHGCCGFVSENIAMWKAETSDGFYNYVGMFEMLLHVALT
jgi:hypothetical protein